MKKLLLIIGAFVCAAFFSIGAASVRALAAYSAEDVILEDDFRKIGMGDTSAVISKGFSASGDKTHGAIPADEWGSPTAIADESYLIYRLGDGAVQMNNLYLSIEAQLWNQNNETANFENAIEVSVGYDGENFDLAKRYTCADAPARTFVDTLDLSVYAEGKTEVFVKVEAKQSKVDCGTENCANGRHKCGLTVATPDGKIDIWHFGIKLFDVCFLSSLPVFDDEQPLPNDFKSKIPAEVYTSAYYTFPEIVFTDNVDGVVDYHITMTDPYNVTEELPVNATGFFVDYEGIYTFEISASDAKGNVYTDKFSITCVLGVGMPVIYFNNIPEKNGRQGVRYETEPLVYDENDVDTLNIYAVDPLGDRVEIEGGGFVPEHIGEYRVMYEAANDAGVTKLLVRVYVKYDVGEGKNVMEMLGDAANWQANASNSPDGVVVSGQTYSVLPLPLSEGIKVTMSLPQAVNSWAGLYFTRAPGFNKYNLDDKEAYKTDDAAPGLYILIYRQTDAYYCNIDYVGLSKTAMEVVNHYNCGAGPALTFALIEEQGDCVSLFINGEKNQNYELNHSVKASVISDNENFVYLGLGNFTGGGATLRSFDVIDSVAPVIAMAAELPVSFSVGDELTLPAITARDSHDGDVGYTLRLFDSEGRIVDEKGRITLEKEGIWYCIVKAEDLSGNASTVIYEINVGNVEKSRAIERQTPIENDGKKGLVTALIISASGVCVSAAAVAVILSIRKRKKQSQ
ncbi:MAG: hypothetical protein IJU84_00865 [Clostridia bacterium]|nr:hypothetical protein [Clostridia bacterium]